MLTHESKWSSRYQLHILDLLVIDCIYSRDILVIIVVDPIPCCLLSHLTDNRSWFNAGTRYIFTATGLISPVRSRTKWVLRNTCVVLVHVEPAPSEWVLVGWMCVQLSNDFVSVDVAPPSKKSASSHCTGDVVANAHSTPLITYLSVINITRSTPPLFGLMAVSIPK